MCGIVGIYYFDRARQVEQAELSAMNNSIIHRGPDDEGAALFGHCGIGMRRLSIIDLGGGHQPIYSPSGKQAIVFNGEAYNFGDHREHLEAIGPALKTRSDTEVVLRLFTHYGAQFLDHINGMFGLAIWDSETESLLVARDRVGIKPVYIYQDAEKLAFASEIKALLAHPDIHAELDRTSLEHFVRYGFSPAPATLFKNIRKLKPGHTLKIEDGHVSEHQYWQPCYNEKFSGSEHDIAEELYELLKSSVRYRMIADVPLGAFLSGGMDSSSIVHLMRDLGSENISTYNIGYGASYAEHDESSEAREIARHYRTNHHEILAEPDVQNLFPELVGYLDEPLADSSFVVTYLVSRLARESVTVVLSGVGGDELFGGYRRYYTAALNQMWQRIPGSLRRGILNPVIEHLPADRNNRVLNYFRLAQGFARAAELPPELHYLDTLSVLPPNILSAPTATPDLLEQAVQACDSGDTLDRMLFCDLKTSLPEQLLLLTDKMSMACSLEVRVPYLDHRVVEFAARIPNALKIKGRALRHIQKQTFETRLPDAVLNRRKRGFGAPIGAWLRHDLRPMIDDLLNEDSLRAQGVFDARTARQLIDDHMDLKRDGTDGILALLSFQIWARQFSVSL